MPAPSSSSSPLPASNLQEENDFLKHYIAQCEHQLRHYQQQLPNLPAPQPPAALTSTSPLPLWLSSPSQLSQLPALLSAYERRVSELTAQVSQLLADGREKDRRLQMSEEEVEDVLDRWRRHLEQEKAGKHTRPVNEEKGGGDEDEQPSIEDSLQVEMESYREQVDILKQQARQRVEEESSARRRQEELIVQLRQQLAVVTRNAAQTQEKKQHDAQRSQLADQYEQQVKAAQRRVEQLTAELSVLKDEKARVDKQLQGAKDDKQRSAVERDERLAIITQLQQTVAMGEESSTKQLATIVALQQQVATLDQQVTLKTQQLQLVTQQRDEQDKRSKQQLDELRREAEANSKAKDERWQAEEARWKDERKATETRLAEERERADRAAREALKAEESHGRLQAEWMRRVEVANRQQAEEAVRVVEREEQRRSEKTRYDREMEELRVNRERNDKEMSALREKARKLTERDDKREQDLTLVQERLAAVTREEGKWEKEAAVTRRLHEQQVGRLEDKVEEVERRRKEERDERERQIAQLTQQLDATSRRCVELEAAKDKLEAEASVLSRKVSDSKDEFERERREKQRWQVQAGELTSQHDSSRHVHDRTRNEHNQLLASLSSLRLAHSSLQEEKEALHRQLDSLNHEAELWRERATAERVKANLARRALDERAHTFVGRVEATTSVVSVPLPPGVDGKAGAMISPLRGSGGVVWTPGEEGSVIWVAWKLGWQSVQQYWSVQQQHDVAGGCCVATRAVSIADAYIVNLVRSDDEAHHPHRCSVMTTLASPAGLCDNNLRQPTSVPHDHVDATEWTEAALVDRRHMRGEH